MQTKEEGPFFLIPAQGLRDHHRFKRHGSSKWGYTCVYTLGFNFEPYLSNPVDKPRQSLLLKNYGVFKWEYFDIIMVKLTLPTTPPKREKVQTGSLRLSLQPFHCHPVDTTSSVYIYAGRYTELI